MYYDNNITIKIKIIDCKIKGGGETGEESGNVDAVMDGKLTQFMNAYLKWLSLGCPDRGALDEE